MKTSVPRLRRIRFKDGRTLEVLRPRTEDPAAAVLMAKLVIETHFKGGPGPHGCAVVLWSSDGATSARVVNDTVIPGILLPDLVRNVLLGHKIESWTISTLNGE